MYCISHVKDLIKFICEFKRQISKRSIVGLHEIYCCCDHQKMYNPKNGNKKERYENFFSINKQQTSIATNSQKDDTCTYNEQQLTKDYLRIGN